MEDNMREKLIIAGAAVLAASASAVAMWCGRSVCRKLVERKIVKDALKMELDFGAATKALGGKETVMGADCNCGDYSSANCRVFEFRATPVRDISFDELTDEIMAEIKKEEEEEEEEEAKDIESEMSTPEKQGHLAMDHVKVDILGVSTLKIEDETIAELDELQKEQTLPEEDKVKEEAALYKTKSPRKRAPKKSIH
jgi:hypothetical protein